MIHSVCVVSRVNIQFKNGFNFVLVIESQRYVTGWPDIKGILGRLIENKLFTKESSFKHLFYQRAWIFEWLQCSHADRGYLCSNFILFNFFPLASSNVLLENAWRRHHSAKFFHELFYLWIRYWKRSWSIPRKIKWRGILHVSGFPCNFVYYAPMTE